MNDERTSFDTPDRVAPEPTAGELLFEFHVPRTHTLWRTELRDHGEVDGVEVQFLDPVDLRFSRTFRNPVRDGDRLWAPRELAIDWAEAERKVLEAGHSTRLDDAVRGDTQSS